MPVGARTETITVTGQAPVVDVMRATTLEAQVSQNVVNLQRRAAGVLPIPVDVPRAGTVAPRSCAARRRRCDDGDACVTRGDNPESATEIAEVTDEHADTESAR